MRVIAALLVFALGVLIAPTASATQQANLTAVASQARSQVASLVREYEVTYGPRVSATERAELRGMIRESRREMNSLVRSVRVAEQRQRLSDWRRAYAQYLEMRALADERLVEVQDILAPAMSFSEQLGAWSQSRSVLQELDSLGAQLERRAR
jgi:hypothetical protein